MTAILLKQFQAEILFSGPYGARGAIAPLTAAGFDVEVMNWVDCNELAGATPYVWAIAMYAGGRRDDAELWREVKTIVAPFDGDVDSAGSGGSRFQEQEYRPKPPWRLELEAEVALERRQAGLEYRVYRARAA